MFHCCIAKFELFEIIKHDFWLSIRYEYKVCREKSKSISTWLLKVQKFDLGFRVIIQSVRTWSWRFSVASIPSSHYSPSDSIVPSPIVNPKKFQFYSFFGLARETIWFVWNSLQMSFFRSHWRLENVKISLFSLPLNGAHESFDEHQYHLKSGENENTQGWRVLSFEVILVYRVLSLLIVGAFDNVTRLLHLSCSSPMNMWNHQRPQNACIHTLNASQHIVPGDTVRMSQFRENNEPCLCNGVPKMWHDLPLIDDDMDESERDALATIAMDQGTQTGFIPRVQVNPAKGASVKFSEDNLGRMKRSEVSLSRTPGNSPESRWNLSTFDHFCETTSLHGWKFLGQSQPSRKLLRFGWMGVVLGSIGVSIFFLSNSIMDFKSSTVQTTQDTSR